jgi:hypothetical protein
MTRDICRLNKQQSIHVLVYLKEILGKLINLKYPSCNIPLRRIFSCILIIRLVRSLRTEYETIRNPSSELHSKTNIFK